MFYIFMFDCLSNIKIIGFETYLYFSHQPQFSLLLQVASETTLLRRGSQLSIVCFIIPFRPFREIGNLCGGEYSETASWIVECMITVNGNTIMIMRLIKLIWTDWNLYQKVIECCLVSCNRKASLLHADILKFANSLKLPCKQIFLEKLFANNFLVILNGSSLREGQGESLRN